MLLRQSLALAGAAAFAGRPDRATAASDVAAAPALSDPHPALARTLTRIGFGSCAESSKPQPIWDAIHERQFDLFVFLGDNIYGDTRDMSVLRSKYAQLAAQPGFVRLRESTPVVAIWDDHDFGETTRAAIIRGRKSRVRSSSISGTSPPDRRAATATVFTRPMSSDPRAGVCR